MFDRGGARPLRTGTSGILCACLAAALVGACGSANQSSSRIDPTLGVAASPRVAEDGESAGRYKLGKPYQVAGRWYEPKDDPGYDKTGPASWYGSRFHGRRTANGEVFDMNGLTAAHPTLPLPSYVRVTNLDNDHSVVVRVNDRGPFGRGRIIDVSRRTAELLGFRRNGTADVRVEYVDLAPLDGNDQDVLMASLQAPADAPGGHDGARPTMVAYSGERPALPALEKLDETLIASGTPFDPYRALIAGRAEGTVQPAAAEAPAAPPVSLALRSSYAPSERVSAAFEAIAALQR